MKSDAGKADKWFITKLYWRQTKDTVNYCVLVNNLLQLMGHELIQLERERKKCKPIIIVWTMMTNHKNNSHNKACL